MRELGKSSDVDARLSEVEIYERIQESKKTRKQELDQENDQEILDAFSVESVFSFFFS